MAILAVAKEFDVSGIVSALGTTLFLFGFGIGPTIWAPLSEVYGRKLPSLVPSLIGLVKRSQQRLLRQKGQGKLRQSST